MDMRTLALASLVIIGAFNSTIYGYEPDGELTPEEQKIEDSAHSLWADFISTFSGCVTKRDKECVASHMASRPRFDDEDPSQVLPKWDRDGGWDRLKSLLAKGKEFERRDIEVKWATNPELYPNGFNVLKIIRSGKSGTKCYAYFNFFSDADGWRFSNMSCE